VSIMTSRHGDFLLRGGSKEAVLNSPTNDTKELLAIATGLIMDLYEEGVPYKKAGISLQGFVPEQAEQATLFGAEESQKTEDWKEVQGVMDELNRRGRDTLLLGSRLRENLWQAKKDARSPAYTTSWKELAEVKA